jgi:hypothetical protein
MQGPAETDSATCILNTTLCVLGAAGLDLVPIFILNIALSVLCSKPVIRS